MKSIASIAAASILLAASYPTFAQAPAQDQTDPPQSVSEPGAMPMSQPMDQTGGETKPMGSTPAQEQAPAAMQPGAMPMGNMPMMQSQSGMMQPGGMMPCMQGRPCMMNGQSGVIRPGGMRCMQGQPGMRRQGMMMNPAMMQARMQRMEEHMANIESLLRQLVELQQQNN